MASSTVGILRGLRVLELGDFRNFTSEGGFKHIETEKSSNDRFNSWGIQWHLTLPLLNHARISPEMGCAMNPKIAVLVRKMIILLMLGPIFGCHLPSFPSGIAAKSRQQACQKRRDAKQIVPLPLHLASLAALAHGIFKALGAVGLSRTKQMTSEGVSFQLKQLTCSFPLKLRRLSLFVEIAHHITKELIGVHHLLYFEFTSTLA